MTHSFEEQIRERAYHLWQSGGMAHGMAHDHWIHAEQAVMAEQMPPAVRKRAKAVKTPVVVKAVAKPAKQRAAKAAAPSKDMPMTAMTKKTPPAARASNTLN